MPIRSAGRKLSFDILDYDGDGDGDGGEVGNSVIHRSVSDPGVVRQNRRKKKHKRKKTSGSGTPKFQDIPEDLIRDECVSLKMEDRSYRSIGASVVTVSEVAAEHNLRGEGYNFGELRLRTVGAGEDTASSRGEESGKEEGGGEVSSRGKQVNGSVVTKLAMAESLDWNRLMAEDPNYLFSVEKSPVKYFMDEMFSGNSLQSTTKRGNEKERERVYDTIFRLPWRCELLPLSSVYPLSSNTKNCSDESSVIRLINVGFFVCFDSFLSLLTIMPMRILKTIWSFLQTRQFKRLSTSELSDFGCFIVMACGVTLLGRTDISLIYHMIRGQGTIKLYVVYNVLEIFDKLCQSFVGDVLQTLFLSAEGLASCSAENVEFWIWRFISDQALAVAASIVHSFVLLVQAITLSTCIVAHNNALLALLVSNNFAEIKSNVFKRFSKDNIHSLVYFDSVERFHISAFVLFVLAQNILEAEGPWFGNFIYNALLVYVCEMAIDIIKHSFIAKFNEIKPIAYSEFLEDLCKQTLNIETENVKKKLTFVPLAPACVVIRVLTPVYAAHIPYGPLPWRFFWIIVLSVVTYVMLGSLKVLIRIGLQKHATWYVNRCRRRKQHAD